MSNAERVAIALVLIGLLVLVYQNTRDIEKLQGDDISDDVRLAQLQINDDVVLAHHRKERSMKKYEAYLKAKKNTAEAKAWHSLTESKHKYRNDSFGISPAHGNLKLVRCGQQVQGGKNYWEAPNSLNEAILQEIADNPEVIDAAINRLEAAEVAALIACKEVVAALCEEIESAEREQ